MNHQDKSKYSRYSLILLMVLAPVLVWLAGRILPEQPYSVMLYDSFWANKINNENHYDAVLAGDSRVYRGIDPAVIHGKTGFSCFNFGFSSAGLEPALLKQAAGLLDPNGKKILLIGITPASFSEESLKNGHFTSLQKINSKDIYIRKKIYPYLSDFNYYSLSDLKKIYRGELYFQTFGKNGFVYSNKIPVDSMEALQPYKDFLDGSRIDEHAVEVFYRMVSMFRENGIRCFAFRIPVASPLRKLEDAVFDFKTFESGFVKAGGYWIDLPQCGFNSYDGSHLDGPSALRLSGVLADSMNQAEYR